MLCERLTGLVLREVLRFPRAKRGADFIPVVYQRVKISKHPRLEIPKLPHFKWQSRCRANFHERNLISRNRDNKPEGWNERRIVSLDILIPLLRLSSRAWGWQVFRLR